MVYTGERVIPWYPSMDWGNMQRHVMRYAWACQFVAGRSVLDLGCGTGYGAFMLSWSARSVCGVDVSPEAIAFASHQFNAPNLRFVRGDLEAEVMRSAEMYIALEVLEHLDDPAAIVSQCRPLVWSMPIDAANQFHKRVYSVEEIDALTLDSGRWVQAEDGQISPRGEQRFEPGFVLGVIE